MSDKENLRCYLGEATIQVLFVAPKDLDEQELYSLAEDYIGQELNNNCNDLQDMYVNIAQGYPVSWDKDCLVYNETNMDITAEEALSYNKEE